MLIFAPVIFVSRAIIVENDAVLSAQRPESMSLPLKWEIPGGKPEAGEDLESSLLRECYEELRIHVRVQERLPQVDREFRGKLYRIVPFLCERIGGRVQVMEHEQVVWQPIDQLFLLEWGPAEEQVLRHWVNALPVEFCKPVGIGL